MNPRPANKSAPPRDAAPVSCDPAKAQRSHPLSGSATAHTQGLPPPAPGSPTCSVNRAALLGFPPTNGGLLTTLFCPLAFPLIIYLGELLVFHSRAQRATSHLPGSRCWHLSRSGVSTSDSGARHPGFKGQLFHTELCDLGQALNLCAVRTSSSQSEAWHIGRAQRISLHRYHPPSVRGKTNEGWKSMSGLWS